MVSRERTFQVFFKTLNNPGPPLFRIDDDYNAQMTKAIAPTPPRVMNIIAFVLRPAGKLFPVHCKPEFEGVGITDDEEGVNRVVGGVDVLDTINAVLKGLAPLVDSWDDFVAATIKPAIS